MLFFLLFVVACEEVVAGDCEERFVSIHENYIVSFFWWKNNGEDLVDFRVAMAKHIFRFKRDIFDYISDSEGGESLSINCPFSLMVL